MQPRKHNKLPSYKKVFLIGDSPDSALTAWKQKALPAHVEDVYAHAVTLQGTSAELLRLSRVAGCLDPDDGSTEMDLLVLATEHIYAVAAMFNLLNIGTSVNVLQHVTLDGGCFQGPTTASVCAWMDEDKVKGRGIDRRTLSTERTGVVRAHPLYRLRTAAEIVLQRIGYTKRSPSKGKE